MKKFLILVAIFALVFSFSLPAFSEAKYKDLTLDQIEKLVDRLGGMDGVKNVMSDSVAVILVLDADDNKNGTDVHMIVVQKEVPPKRKLLPSTAIGPTEVKLTKDLLTSALWARGYKSSPRINGVFVKYFPPCGTIIKCWIVSYHDNPTFAEVIADMNEGGYRPASLLEGAAFMIENPKWVSDGTGMPILLLGEMYKGSYPALCRQDGANTVDLFLDSAETKKVFYLAIEK
ncbi:MAG TPA: hypothetical protein P5056_03445 [Candidatus Paceibacterota bacterium]|nr:hypothetical protein [Candidatus Paceibacterota bacterium]